MRQTGIKICGLSTPASIAWAAAARASHVGFMFYPPSPRAVTLDQARGLRTAVPAGIAAVGVFVDPDDALLAAACDGLHLDAIQLHGHEPPGRVADVRRRFGVPVWKAVGVRTAADIAASAVHGEVADLVLYDARPPAAGTAALPGGNGLRFDWHLLADQPPQRPWGLAGGLDADSVADAVRLLRPWVVDVSSGVEEAPGVKSQAKIAAFCQAVPR